jgi:hypothetical protein
LRNPVEGIDKFRVSLRGVNYFSDREGAEHVARAIIDSSGEVIAVGADISKAADVAQLFKEVHRYRTPGSVPGIRRISLDHRRGDQGGRRTCCSHLSAMSRPL